ncbi:MAG: HD domain-containing protein [Coriobacteriia bacterium]|nr:HD domain-containing protein [Coriobacteriia bacterium]
MSRAPLADITRSDLAALVRVSLALAGSLDLESVLQTSVEAAVEVLGLQTGAVYLCLDDDVVLLGATTPPLPRGFADEFRLAGLDRHPHLRSALESSDPVFIPDVDAAVLSEPELAIVTVRGLRSLLFVPLVADSQAVGALILGTDHPNVYTADDVALSRALSALIAVSVVNARLFEEAQRAAAELICAYDSTLEGWSFALEMRDADTLGHTERSALLAVEMAASLGVPHHDLPQVRRGALLHDIGKMVIPDAILHKPGPLTDEEWAVMREHPRYARELLSRIEFLSDAMDIPYYHHERWDGTGYPEGLAGEDIPLSARVFSVIDVYDALTSDRPYRQAWSKSDALEYIREQSGMQFDPAVVEAFLVRIEEPFGR